DFEGGEKGLTCTTTAGMINTKLRETVEYSQTNRENQETCRLDQPIPSYTRNRLEALWIRKHGYLDNGCVEFYKICVPRKGSARGMNNPKSERSDAELRERLWHDLEHGPLHKNANISGATGPIRTILISTWSIRRGLQSSQKARGAAQKRARYE
ncbi:hypothetical protein M404DRAFT_1009255, partial [Pisolithus tinctorius Marx 270]